MLKSLSRPDRFRITEKIVALGANPDDSGLDVKPLSGKGCYRLRIGDWRILYERDDEIRVIAIERIKSRGGVYK